MSDEQSGTPEWVRVTFAGRFQPPGLPAKLRSGATGSVSDRGIIESDDFDAKLVLDDKDAIEPGADVRLTLRKGHAYALPVDKFERLQTAKRARRRYKQWERRRSKEVARKKRREFWGQYDIPIEFTTGQNSRLGELERGSSGTGRTEHTVTHFVVLEDFVDGRLERDDGDFLCRQKGRFPDRPTTGQADEKEPKVTCNSCLEKMERWAVKAQDE